MKPVTATPYQVGNFEPRTIFGGATEVPVEVATFKRKKDAKYVVRVCNERDDFVKALKAAKNYITTYGVENDGETLTSQAASAMAPIDAALAKAGAA